MGYEALVLVGSDGLTFNILLGVVS